MSKVLLCSVSDDRFGRKDGLYEKTQKKIESIFKNNPEFGISDFLMWNWEAIVQTEFYKENKVLLNNPDPSKNGRAYKPAVIAEALKQVAWYDYVVYTDSSPEMFPMDEDYKIPPTYNITVIKQLCEANNGILTAFVKWDTRPIKHGMLGTHTHANFTTDRCIQVMGLQEYRNCFMHASGMVVIQKLPHTVAFIDEWLKWNVNEQTTLGPAEKPDDYSYWDTEDETKQGHRFDQSISGLLINKYGYKLVDPPHTELHPYNFLNFCRIDTNYNFIDPNINPETIVRIKKGDMVTNSKGQRLKVFEVWPGENGREFYVVGVHREGAYKTTEDNLTL